MSDTKNTDFNAVYQKLLKVRDAENLKLKPSKYLKQEMMSKTGSLEPLRLRHYQIQMVLHILAMKRFIVGDGAGLGKTLETITGLCYLWEKQPDLKVVIVTDTSAMRQWGNEIDKFTNEVDWTLVEGTPKKRHGIYEHFFKKNPNGDFPEVIITNYHRLKNDRLVFLQHAKGNKFALILDEITAVKSPKSQVHSAIKDISFYADRVYGLTATLIKNNLVEGFGIFGVVLPEIFPNLKAFQKQYCITRRQPIPNRKGRFVEVVVGHSKSQIKSFRDKISPYYLGRATHEVSSELPVLTTREMPVTLTRSQWIYYKEALEGLLTINAGSEEEDSIETTKLTQLIYCQEIVDSPILIGNPSKSAKEEALLDMIQGEFDGEKIIVFTRFKEMVNQLQKVLESKGWCLGIEQSGDKEWNPISDTSKKSFVRITGDEDSKMRDAGRRAFTETPNVNVIFLTMAGSQAINLQQAKAMIFFDLPWSAGDYIQLVGRMIRIGSPHQRVLAVHLLGEGPLGEETIDHHVNATLNKKMRWIEGTLGKRLIQEKESNNEDEVVMDSSSSTADIFKRMINSARS